MQVLCAVIAHTPRGSTVPAAVGVQRPSDEGTLHLRHAPVQAVSQQTPSTQWLFWHSLSALHGWPSIFGPQVPSPRLFVTHAMPVSQSAELLQILVHAPDAQRNG
jgi:hypothetical protein